MKDNKTNLRNNDDIKKYDMIFIGGGPATISFICYLFQHNLSDKVFNGSNILIIEKNENFGSGCLGFYGINSNTSAEGFPRLICQGENKEKYIKEGLSPSKQPMKNSENYKEKENISNIKIKDKKNINENYNNNTNSYNEKKEKIKNLRENQKKFSENVNNQLVYHTNKINNLYINNNENDCINNSNNNNSDREEFGSAFDLCDNKRNNIIFHPMNIFSEIYNSSAVKTLLAIGNRPAPLSLVGFFLNSLGNFLVNFIKKKYNKNILINKCEAKKIKIYNNGDFGVLINGENNNCISENAIVNQQNSNENNTTKSNFILKTKSLILSSGGKQDQDNPFFLKIEEIKGKNRLFESDSVLKEWGYVKLLKEILKDFALELNSNKDEPLKKKKIVIIGGSHSAFSCAWILLNDPSTYENIKIGDDFEEKLDFKCPKCRAFLGKIKYLENFLNKKIEKKPENIINEGDSTNFITEKLKNFLAQKFSKTLKNKKMQLIEEIPILNIDSLLDTEQLEKLILEIKCNCNGKINNNIWKYSELDNIEAETIKNLTKIMKNSIEFTDENKKYIIEKLISYIKKYLLNIKILYRDHIKVFYPNEREAIEDGYNCFNRREAFNKQGKIYPFVGLRGDAKDLYKNILNKEEKRIELINANTINEQLDYINDGDYIIWACGYNTNSVNIVDHRNTPVEFHYESNGMIDVSKDLFILNKNKELIKNLFGIGQGYSTKTPEIINGKKSRADSLHLYNTHTARRLYNSLKEIIAKNNIEMINKVANNNGNGNGFINKKINSVNSFSNKNINNIRKNSNIEDSEFISNNINNNNSAVKNSNKLPAIKNNINNNKERDSNLLNKDSFYSNLNINQISNRNNECESKSDLISKYESSSKIFNLTNKSKNSISNNNINYPNSSNNTSKYANYNLNKEKEILPKINSNNFNSINKNSITKNIQEKKKLISKINNLTSNRTLPEKENTNNDSNNPLFNNNKKQKNLNCNLNLNINKKHINKEKEKEKEFLNKTFTRQNLPKYFVEIFSLKNSIKVNKELNKTIESKKKFIAKNLFFSKESNNLNSAKTNNEEKKLNEYKSISNKNINKIPKAENMNNKIKLNLPGLKSLKEINFVQSNTNLNSANRKYMEKNNEFKSQFLLQNDSIINSNKKFDY